MLRAMLFMLVVASCKGKPYVNNGLNAGITAVYDIGDLQFHRFLHIVKGVGLHCTPYFHLFTYDLIDVHECSWAEPR